MQEPALSRCNDRIEAQEQYDGDEVTNLWLNRLMGDQPSEKVKYTFTTRHPYKAGSPRRRAGLLRPVLLIREESRSLRRRDEKGQLGYSLVERLD